ncbi:hypothetical protein [Synechococcus sp. PCC 7336]|uniref:hypothetical protein n=1 Tax=Synechococcus sp. PCC 7336 TaxID=195250 RepID=UPI000346374A|nr:hypothetical protein [Synechococcus sp. PCC 7336]
MQQSIRSHSKDCQSSKVEAFEGRGRGDFYASADFEDIIMEVMMGICGGDR